MLRDCEDILRRLRDARRIPFAAWVRIPGPKLLIPPSEYPGPELGVAGH